jgi:DNA-binding MarR family transcriptional regulator
MTSQILMEQSTRALDAWVRLLRAHAACTRALSAELVSEHGLTINDFEALAHLAREEGQRMRRVDLSERLLLTPSGVTRLLSGLERAGYVEKASCSSDARVTYAVLTEAGRRKLAEASCAHFEAIETLFGEHLAENEVAQLSELLGRLPGGGGPTDCAA